MFATGHHNGMNGGQEPAPKYFYYRVFEEGLGLYVRNQFAPDKSLGRVDERRVFPKTVAIFKRAVAKHENISLSRVAKLLFTPEGSDAPEAAQITTADPSAPGASIQNPFLIVLSKVVDGVADIVMSQEDEHLAAYEGRPQGWVDIQPSSSSETSVYLFRRVWESGAPTLRLTTAGGRYLSPEELVYAKPFTEMFTRDGDRCVVLQVVIPSDRVFGYVRRSLITYQP